jgi:hypothetical protein
MNYLAQGLNQGFEAGSAARRDKKRLEEEARQKAAERELALDRDVKRAAVERELQQTRLDADAKERGAERTLKQQEAKKDRKFTRKRDEDRQWFEGTERGADRAARAGESAAERELRLQIADRQAASDKARLDQASAQFGKTYELQKSELDAKQRGTMTDDVDPTTGAVRSRTIRQPMGALGNPAPTTPPADAARAGGKPQGAATYATEQDVAKAYQAKQITREQAAEILEKKFGVPRATR